MKKKNTNTLTNSRPEAKLIHRLFPGLLTAIIILSILWLTLAPHPLPETNLPLFPGADKLVHAIMFGTLAGVLCLDRDLWRVRRLKRTGLLPAGSSLIPPRHVAIIICIIIATVAFGGLIEVLQEQMHAGRTSDGWDFVADTAGAITGGIAGPSVARWITGLKDY